MKAAKELLFVCMGNICRSPAGEGVLRQRIAERGLTGRIQVDSAGTIGYHVGEQADRRMREAASARGYALESRGRQFDVKDFERFDLIVAMDRDNQRDILALDPAGRYRAKVRLLSDFLDRATGPGGTSWPLDVPDPYYGGAAGFEYVLDMIEAAAAPIISALGLEP